MGVAATKTFCTVAFFYGLAIKFSQIKSSRSKEEISELISLLINLPPTLEDLIEEHNKSSEKLAQFF